MSESVKLLIELSKLKLKLKLILKKKIKKKKNSTYCVFQIKKFIFSINILSCRVKYYRQL